MKSDILDEQLWDGLQQYVRETMGQVGIFKMLGLRSEQAAGPYWASRVRPLIDALASTVPISIVGPARLTLSDGVDMQLTIHDCIISVDGAPRWSTGVNVDPEALVVAVIGGQRWEASWVRSLGNASKRHVVWTPPGSFGSDALPWVAQNPGGPAPYTSAASEADARLAAAAEERGSVEVQRLFAEFERKRS